MTISLDELAELAKAPCTQPWWNEKELGKGVRHFGDEAAFIAACDPATILRLLAVVKAAKRLVTATYTIADTGCFNAADDAVKQAENALSALDTP